MIGIISAYHNGGGLQTTAKPTTKMTTKRTTKRPPTTKENNPWTWPTNWPTKFPTPTWPTIVTKVISDKKDQMEYERDLNMGLRYGTEIWSILYGVLVRFSILAEKHTDNI